MSDLQQQQQINRLNWTKALELTFCSNIQVFLSHGTNGQVACSRCNIVEVNGSQSTRNRIALSFSELKNYCSFLENYDPQTNPVFTYFALTITKTPANNIIAIKGHQKFEVNENKYLELIDILSVYNKFLETKRMESSEKSNFCFLLADIYIYLRLANFTGDSATWPVIQDDRIEEALRSHPDNIFAPFLSKIKCPLQLDVNITADMFKERISASNMRVIRFRIENTSFLSSLIKVINKF